MKNNIINQNLEKLFIILIILIITYTTWYFGSNQIIDEQQYRGMRKLNYDKNFLLSLFFLTVAFLIFFYCNLNTSEGILITIFFIFTYVWFFIFYSVSGYTDLSLIFYGSLIFLTPSIFLFISGKYFKINFRLHLLKFGLIKIRVELVLTIIILTVIFILFKKMNLSFSFIDSYERRLSGRDEISGVFGYLFNMVTNGLSPLLAYLAFYNRRYFYFIIPFIYAILNYGFIGAKAPIAYVFLMSAIGIYNSIGGNRTILLLITSVAGLMLTSFIELIIFDYSYVGAYFIRRMILVLAQLNMYFLDFIFFYQNSVESFFLGNQIPGEIDYLIGEIYYNNRNTNVGTITFLMELGKRGMIGYLFNILFLIIFCCFLSYMFRSSKHQVWNAISIQYALLLLGQSYTTAFISSGIGFSILILCLFSYKKN